jgi:hypothetical protein
MGNRTQDECARLRRELTKLQGELSADEGRLQQLRNSGATQASIDEAALVVQLRGEEVASTREEMRARGCFQLPPPPPPLPPFVELGPGPVLDDSGKLLGTGAVVDIAAHPTDSRVIFVATAGGGVWRTREASAANQVPVWQPLTDQMPSTAMGAVEIGRGDPSGRTVFAGTGCFSSFCSTGPAVGLYKSTDGGDTWFSKAAGLLNGSLIRSIVTLPAPNQHVVLLAARALAGGPGGIFRSTDDGEHFVSVSGLLTPPDQASNLPPGDGWDLLVDPVHPGRVYATIAGAQPGIYRSGTAGATWSAVNAGITATDLAGASSQWVRLALGVGPDGLLSSLYAGFIAGGQLTQIYTSSTTNESWSTVTLPPGGSATVHPVKQGYAKFAIGAHPTQPFLYVAGDGEIWRADLTDRSNPDWKQVSGIADFAGANVPPGSPHTDYQAFVFDAAGDLLAANDGGIYRLVGTTTAEPKWLHIGRTIRNNEPLGIAYDTLAGVATVGSGDNGIAFEDGPGVRNWRQLHGGDGGAQGVDNHAADFSWRYGLQVETCTLSCLYRHKFDAANTQITQDAAGNAVGGQVTMAAPRTPRIQFSGLGADASKGGAFVLNDVAADRLLLGAINVFESVDGGATVRRVIRRPLNRLGKPVTPGPLQMACGGRANSVDLPEVAYVGFGNQLWVRGARASSFARVPGYTGGRITSLAMDPHDWTRVYVTDNTHVYQSTTAGQSWTECTGNLLSIVPDAQGAGQFGCIVVFRSGPADLVEAVVVGAQGGLYKTLNPGDGPSALWSKFGSRLPRAGAADLKYYPAAQRGGRPTGDVLVVGLQGRGVWRLSDASHYLTVPTT